MSELNIDTEKELHIGKKCFYKLLKLKTIKISTELSTINEGSFDSCPGKDKIPKVYFNDHKMKNFTYSSEKVQQLINRRKQNAQPKYEKLVLKNDKCFNSFYILGFDMFQHKPSIIAMFPQRPHNISQIIVNQILYFCYPQKVNQINQNDQIPHNILDGFVFYIADPKSVGVVLHISIPSDANSFVGDQYDRSYPFALCLISNNPNISSHFEFLSSIVDSIVNKPNGVIRTVEIPKLLQGQKGQCFEGFYPDPKCEYIALSPSVRSLDFLFPDLVDYYVKKYPPTLEQTDYFLYPTLQTLLTFLTPEIIINIFLCILYESQIILYSKNMNRLSFCILALTNLTKEIDITCYINPIIPDAEDFRDILFGITPCVYGFNRRSGEPDVFIDIDHGKFERIIYKNQQNAPNPHFPYSEKLIKKIKVFLKKHLSNMRIPQQTISNTLNPEYIKLINNADQNIYPKCFQYFAQSNYILTPGFIKGFTQLIAEPFFSSLKNYIKAFFVTDTSILNQPITVFDKTMFDFHIQDKYKDFMDAFSSTDIFDKFQSKIEKEISESKNYDSIQNLHKHNIFSKNKYQIYMVIKKLPKQRRMSFTKDDRKKLLK